MDEKIVIDHNGTSLTLEDGHRITIVPLWTRMIQIDDVEYKLSQLPLELSLPKGRLSIYDGNKQMVCCFRPLALRPPQQAALPTPTKSDLPFISPSVEPALQANIEIWRSRLNDPSPKHEVQTRTASTIKGESSIRNAEQAEPLTLSDTEEDKHAVKITNSRRRFLLQLLRDLAMTDNAEAFREPVNAIALGMEEYPEIITLPMDISTIQNRLECGLYPSTRKCIEDFDLMVQNAINWADHDVRCTEDVKNIHVKEAAVRLQTIFRESMADLPGGEDIETGRGRGGNGNSGRLRARKDVSSGIDDTESEPRQAKRRKTRGALHSDPAKSDGKAAPEASVLKRPTRSQISSPRTRRVLNRKRSAMTRENEAENASATSSSSTTSSTEEYQDNSIDDTGSYDPTANETDSDDISERIIAIPDELDPDTDY